MPDVLWRDLRGPSAGGRIHSASTALRSNQLVTGKIIIGVSLDSIERLNDFSADPEYCAGKLAVASDIDGSISQSFDISVRQRREGMTDTRGIAVDHDLAERTTFIVTSDGRIAETIGGISPIENVEQSLAAVQRLQ